MSLKYQDPEYARERLTGTVVRLGDRPVYVEYIDDDGMAGVSHTAFPKVETVSLEDLDLTPVPLGNVNSKWGVAYVSRVPKRRDWRQGLRDNNMSVLSVGREYAERVSPMSKYLAHTIMGIFPKLPECIDRIECGEVEALAFSRHFSVHRKDDKGYRLFFKCDHVGWVYPALDGGINFQLQDDKEYLREMVIEEMKLV